MKLAAARQVGWGELAVYSWSERQQRSDANVRIQGVIKVFQTVPQQHGPTL